MTANAGSVDARRRQPSEMIEHDGAGQALQQVGGADDLVAAQMNLHVPAERLDALRQRLDHVERGGRGLRVELGEADAADAAGLPCAFSSASVTVGCTTATPRACGAELRDGVERHRVVGDVGRGLSPRPRGWCRCAAATAGTPGRAAFGLHPRLGPRRRETRSPS